MSVLMPAILCAWARCRAGVHASENRRGDITPDGDSQEQQRDSETYFYESHDFFLYAFIESRPSHSLFGRSKFGCGGGIRTRDLQVMSLASWPLLYSAPYAVLGVRPTAASTLDTTN